MEASAIARVLAGLALVVCVILACAWLARRLGLTGQATARPRTLRLAAALTLGPRHRIAVIEVENARLVVGLGPRDVRLLHTLPAQDPGTSPDASPGSGATAVPQAAPSDPTRPTSPAGHGGFQAALAQSLRKIRAPSS